MAEPLPEVNHHGPGALPEEDIREPPGGCRSAAPTAEALDAVEAGLLLDALETLDGGLNSLPNRDLIVEGLEQLRARIHPVMPSTHEAYPYSDAYNALALVRLHGHEMRYCAPWKAWLTWQETHWQRDTTDLMMRWQRQTLQSLWYAVDGLGKAEVKRLQRHLARSLNTGKLKAAVEQAQSWEGITIGQEGLDADPWVLNCANGTLDLQTGVLRTHRQHDMLTKCLDIPYEPTATCPLWQQFLWRIMGGSQGQDDPDTMGAGEMENRDLADRGATAMVAFLQRCIGYALTGSTREQCLFILHGPTKTGKSTFLATIRALLGPYGQQADMESFMQKDRQEVRNDIADLAGSRFVCALEGQEGRRLAEALVKQMTGGSDLLKARFLYAEYFSFKPQFKVFLGTNHKPDIRDPDGAIWERIRPVPFAVQIPPQEREKDLEERLLAELPGILAWAVRGCQDWLQRGELAEPALVLESAADYREEMDEAGRFLQENCLLGQPHYKTKASVLLAAYHAWCGHSRLSAKAFTKRLQDKGYEAKRETTGMFWQGIGLPSDDRETR